MGYTERAWENFKLNFCIFAAESGESSAVDSADSTKAWADERSLAFRVFKEQCQHPFIAYPYLLNAHAGCQTISD